VVKPLYFTSSLFDAETIALMEDIFVVANLTEVIIRTHVLVEHAMKLAIAQRLARPAVITSRDSKWSYAQMASLYAGLYDPPEEDERLIRGLNKLRNIAAHQLQVEESVVQVCLPWEGDIFSHPPTAVSHVRTVAMVLLFGRLRAIDSASRTDWLVESIPELSRLGDVAPDRVEQMHAIIRKLGPHATVEVLEWFVTAVAEALTPQQRDLLRGLCRRQRLVRREISQVPPAELDALCSIGVILVSGEEVTVNDSPFARGVVAAVSS
jgi:hypothetical protein